MHHPRLYELVGLIGFLGMRSRVYDGLVRLSGAAPGERVLDVGCGTGALTRRVARAVGSAGRVVGIDPSEEMVRYARRHSPSNCDYRIAGAEAVPEPDASFDLAVSSLAVHHIPDDKREKAMAELMRVVRPGGRILIADFRGGAQAVRELVEGAGFDVTGSGRHRRFMSYLQARRP